LDSISDTIGIKGSLEQNEHAQTITRKFGFFALGDESWARNRAMGFENSFLARQETVYDSATELLWQMSGSTESIPFSGVDGYLRSLNLQNFGGRSDRRLPNLAEA
jgi:hypothetical protein